MNVFLFALALLAAPEPSTPAAAQAEPPPAVSAEPAPIAAPEPTPVAAPEPLAAAEPELPYPVGAPTDDYGLVSWCYGALGGYLDLHDRVLPEVTRIEDAYRRPGTSLADDMATYDDMAKISRTNMKLFARAMEAAERASLQPINVRGAAAVRKGRASWVGAQGLPDRTVAQQWMGWALPVRCTPTATALESRAKLLGATFKVNEAETEVPLQPPEATPVTDTTVQAGAAEDPTSPPSDPSNSPAPRP